jgi:hypothetical protein
VGIGPDYATIFLYSTTNTVFYICTTDFHTIIFILFYFVLFCFLFFWNGTGVPGACVASAGPLQALDAWCGGAVPCAYGALGALGALGTQQTCGVGRQIP